jgi:hypothetical protein
MNKLIVLLLTINLTTISIKLLSAETIQDVISEIPIIYHECKSIIQFDCFTNLSIQIFKFHFRQYSRFL